MRAAALAFALPLLPGCVAELRDEVARGAARAAVRPVLEARLPGVPVEPAVDCVIDNATADEIITLAHDGALGGQITPESRRIVIAILQRRETIACLVDEGLPAFLGGF